MVRSIALNSPSPVDTSPAEPAEGSRDVIELKGKGLDGGAQGISETDV